MSKQITNNLPWSAKKPNMIPKIANAEQMVQLGQQLTNRDRKQMIQAYNSESFEMLGNFVWTKTITTLKYQLSKMGVTFIAELLDRPDIGEESNLIKEISEYEAIRLAEELGVITGTGAFRLKRAMDTIAHFNEKDLDHPTDDEMSDEEIKLILRSCIEGVLSYEKVEAALDFKNFRQKLESEILNESDPDVVKLISSPYFFHRTTLRILLSIIKSSIGAKLETSLANANVIIPKLWGNLKDSEKFQIGRSYAELNSDGKTKATKGIKSVLLKVKGFDYVPEDLRSNSFIIAANEVLEAHNGFDNFYNEPAPMRHLQSMGNVIPAPAFAICLTATLAVKLGNSSGVSVGAQQYANSMLKNITKDRWIYYFKNCLPTDEIILYKLTQTSPLNRWLDYFNDTEFIDDLITQVSEKEIIKLLSFMKISNVDKIKRHAKKMYHDLGYGTD